MALPKALANWRLSILWSKHLLAGYPRELRYNAIARVSYHRQLTPEIGF